MAFTGCNRNGHRLLMAFHLGKDEGVWLKLQGSSVYTLASPPPAARFFPRISPGGSNVLWRSSGHTQACDSSRRKDHRLPGQQADARRGLTCWLKRTYARAEIDWRFMPDERWFELYAPELDNLRAGLAWVLVRVVQQ
jgi:hypothetical protein